MRKTRNTCSRRVGVLSRALIAVSLVPGAWANGCKDAADDRPAAREKTNAFGRFKEIRNIRVDVKTFDGKAIVWDIPAANWREFESIFESGIRSTNADKREAYGQIRITAGHTDSVWTVLYANSDEFVLKVSDDECWRGISRRDLVKFVEGCEAHDAAAPGDSRRK
jgi:hypothetical protein